MNALKIAKIHNFDRYISFYSNLSLEEAGELCYKFKAVVEKKPTSLHSQINYFFGIQGGFLSDRRWAVWSEQLTEKVNRLRQFVSFSEEFEQPLYVGAWYDENFAFLHMGNPEKELSFVTRKSTLTSLHRKIIPTSLRLNSEKAYRHLVQQTHEKSFRLTQEIPSRHRTCSLRLQ